MDKKEAYKIVLEDLKKFPHFVDYTMPAELNMENMS